MLSHGFVTCLWLKTHAPNQRRRQEPPAGGLGGPSRALSRGHPAPRRGPDPCPQSRPTRDPLLPHLQTGSSLIQLFPGARLAIIGLSRRAASTAPARASPEQRPVSRLGRSATRSHVTPPVSGRPARPTPGLLPLGWRFTITTSPTPPPPAPCMPPPPPSLPAAGGTPRPVPAPVPCCDAAADNSASRGAVLSSCGARSPSFCKISRFLSAHISARLFCSLPDTEPPHTASRAPCGASACRASPVLASTATSTLT